MKFKIKVVIKDGGGTAWYLNFNEGTTQFESKAHVFSAEDFDEGIWPWFKSAEHNKNQFDFLRLKLVV